MSTPARPPQIQVKEVDDLSGWGGWPKSEAHLTRPEKMVALSPVEGQQIARGLGRSYGDAAVLSEGTTVLTERLDRMLTFNAETGVLRAEAGVTLEDVLKVFVPQGWFLPVTPGTKFCTLGGCLAADVHGKNHHVEGSFSRYVESARLVPADGAERIISPTENAELFWATVGGMGLTGFIRDITLRLKPIETSLMKVNHKSAANLAEAMELMKVDDPNMPYCVAWIDCVASGEKLGRSVVMTGRHAYRSEIPTKIENPLECRFKGQKPMPFNFPSFALNRFTVGTFNSFYHWQQGRKGEFLTGFDPYFYPLDGIKNWGRMYGKAGFLQYQFVIPDEGAEEVLTSVLEKVSLSGNASFLAVLKRMGEASPGLLSFPISGWTLALDIPVTDKALEMLDDLDELISDAGGRLYLAKDSRLDPDTFRAMYPRVPELRKLLMDYDPDQKFASNLSKRLGVHGG